MFLTHMTVFSDSVDPRTADDATYFDFSKAFDTVTHNILTGKSVKHGSGIRTVRWVKNLVNHWIQRVTPAAKISTGDLFQQHTSRISAGVHIVQLLLSDLDDRAQNWEEWLMNHMGVLPIRGILTD